MTENAISTTRVIDLGNRTDYIAITLNIAIALLTFWIAKLGMNVARETGNIAWWLAFTAGWFTIGFARIVTALTYVGVVGIDWQNYATLVVVVALIVMLYAMMCFANTIFAEGKKHVVG